VNGSGRTVSKGGPVDLIAMPFKLNTAPPHFEERSWVTNWSTFETGLCRRGTLTFVIDEAAIKLAVLRDGGLGGPAS